jgi:hypothetical protein
MQQIVSDYRAAGENWPATKMEIAEWAIRAGKWQMPRAAIVSRCADDIGDAMREYYFTDNAGRRVRLLHPATKKRQGVLFTEWDDIRTAPREHMQLSFQQKRKAIVGECRQLKTDMDSYNGAHPNGEPIQISFNFEMDIAEFEAALAA